MQAHTDRQNEEKKKKEPNFFQVVKKRKWRWEGTRQLHSYMEGSAATSTVNLRFLDDHSARAIITNYHFRKLVETGKIPKKMKEKNEKKRERMVSTAPRKHRSKIFSSAFSEQKSRGPDIGREKNIHKSWFFQTALKSENQCRDIGSSTLIMQLLKR